MVVSSHVCRASTTVIKLLGCFLSKTKSFRRIVCDASKKLLLQHTSDSDEPQKLTYTVYDQLLFDSCVGVLPILGLNALCEINT